MNRTISPDGEQYNFGVLHVTQGNLHMNIKVILENKKRPPIQTELAIFLFWVHFKMSGFSSRRAFLFRTIYHDCTYDVSNNV